MSEDVARKKETGMMDDSGKRMVRETDGLEEEGERRRTQRERKQGNKPKQCIRLRAEGKHDDGIQRLTALCFFHKEHIGHKRSVHVSHFLPEPRRCFFHKEYIGHKRSVYVSHFLPEPRR